LSSKLLITLAVNHSGQLASTKTET